VALPGDTGEAGALLGMASKKGWRVYLAGKNRFPAGQELPPADLLISTLRLQAPAEYEPGDLTVTLRGGHPLPELEQLAGEAGQWFPADPPGWEGGTVGSLVASGRAGSLHPGFGAPRDHVLGVTLVTGEGRIVEAGGRVMKNVAGFDLVRLAVGSRGSLGLVAGATLRLFPLPRVDRTLVFPGRSTAALLPLARRMALSPLPLVALELLGEGVGASSGPPSSPAVAVRLMGNQEAVDAMEEGLRGTGDFLRLEGESSRRFFRELRRSEEGGEVRVRLTLLPSRLGEALALAEELVSRWDGGDGSPPFLVAHVTRGTVRVSLPVPAASAWETRRALLEEIRGRVYGEGGSLLVRGVPSAGWPGEGGGPGPSSGETLFPDPRGRLEEGLRRVFDPAGILLCRRGP